MLRGPVKDQARTTKKPQSKRTIESWESKILSNSSCRSCTHLPLTSSSDSFIAFSLGASFVAGRPRARLEDAAGGGAAFRRALIAGYARGTRAGWLISADVAPFGELVEPE